MLSLDDDAVAASGDYRNFFEHAGRRDSHTIDPRTGRPVARALAAVGVVARSAMHADVLPTALMVLGPEQSCVLAAAPGVAALLRVRGERGPEEHLTPAFARRLVG